MVVFLIIVAVLVILITAIMCLSATVTLVYENGWHTKLSVLFIEKDIKLGEILSFLLFPERKAQQVAKESKKKKDKKQQTAEEDVKTDKAEEAEKIAGEVVSEDSPDKEQVSDAVKEIVIEDSNGQAYRVIEGEDGPTAVYAVPAEEETDEASEEKTAEESQGKQNFIKKIWDDEGIVGMLTFASNLIETANSAILTLFRGLHIYSLYVMIIVGGGDADSIARSYGTLCKYYYPVKGVILNGMRVDNYDDYIEPDYLASSTEFQMQLIASISVGLLVKMVLKAGIVFLKNLIKDKNSK